MQIYLVGGAVRDKLLGLPVREYDWVVVGATPDKLLAQGYKPVGKDFPVFLHPKTHEEYALARTERKVGKGYKGFSFYSAPDVTLEQDLARRDLTVNAIAQSADGVLIDPYHGQQDLNQKILRHVSPAFSEDPVRILRAARFAAKLPDFSLAEETLKLMHDMVKAGEVDALVAERVWQEIEKTLSMPEPNRFFAILEQCGALSRLMPYMRDNAVGLQALLKACQQTDDPVIRFACLSYPLTTKDLRKLIKQYRVPNRFAVAAMLVNEFHSSYSQLNLADATEIIKLIKSLDSLRRPQRLQTFITICTLCLPDDHRQTANALIQAHQCLQQIDTTMLQTQGLKGPDFASALNQLQLEAVQKSLADR